MKIALLLLLLSSAVASAQILSQIFFQNSAPAVCGNGFLHCNSITWDHTQAGAADTANFVGLIDVTKIDWSYVATGGGYVQHTVTQSGGSFGGEAPADFVFTTDAGCAIPVAGWEFETYITATGRMIAWVNIGTLSHTVDTVIWACYDKTSITTQQNTVTATWDTAYKAVYHFSDDLDYLGLVDSTSGANTLTKTGTVASGSGQIGSGAVYPGLSFLSSSGFSLGTNIVTMEAWVFSSTMSSQNPGIFIEHSPVNGSWLIMDANGTLLLRGIAGSDVNSSGTMSNSVWYSVGGSITGTSGANYINATTTTGTVIPFTDASNGLNIGTYDAGAGVFTGTFDEVRVSNIVRTPSYFTARYNQEKSGQNMVSVGTLQ